MNAPTNRTNPSASVEKASTVFSRSRPWSSLRNGDDSFREHSPNIADGTRSATRSFCRRELVRVFRRCKLVWLRPSVALNERYSSNSVRVRSDACKHRERQRKGGKRQTRWKRGRRFRRPRSRIFQARRVCAA